MSPEGRPGDRDGGPAPVAGAPPADGRTEQVLALAEERLSVGKRIVETGRVRVSIATATAEEIVRETLRSRRAEVERVAIGREVAEAPAVRQEGDVLVVSVVEEVLVVEKRLVLREEIRLRFVDTETTVERPVGRRVQRATVERLPPRGAAAPSPGTVEWNGNDTDDANDAQGTQR